MPYVVSHCKCLTVPNITCIIGDGVIIFSTRVAYRMSNSRGVTPQLRVDTPSV